MRVEGTRNVRNLRREAPLRKLAHRDFGGKTGRDHCHESLRHMRGSQASVCAIRKRGWLLEPLPAPISAPLSTLRTVIAGKWRAHVLD